MPKSLTMMICLFLGHIEEPVALKLGKVVQEDVEATRCKRCGRIQIPVAQFNQPVSMPNVEDDRELCILSILRKEDSASTKRIIELASTPEFDHICRDCKSGVEVYETAMRLHRTGRISRKPGRDGFMWSLVEH